MSTAVAERSWSVIVPHHARGARAARHRIAIELADVVPAPQLADLIAIVGELVGNAIRHADPLPGGVVRVTWRVRPGGGPLADTIEVRVTDGGAGVRRPNARPAGPEAIDGRGLHIVEALASRWGVDHDGLGQCVWAELSSPAVAA